MSGSRKSQVLVMINPTQGAPDVGNVGKPPSEKKASGIYNCQVMKEAKPFKSKTTGESYKIKQIDRNSKNVVYLVECKKCGKQGVRSTEDFKSRISNYIAHVFEKRPTCKTVQHFYLTEGLH